MTWLQRLMHKRQLEVQLDKEVRFHVEQHTADLVAQGVDPIEARRLANLEIGGPEQIKEECRDARGTRWLDDFVQDVRYALRSLRHNPGFAAVALLTLALGSGATTVMFTVVNGVLLKPLPYPNPERLVSVHGRSSNWNTGLYGEQNIAYPDFKDIRRASRALDTAGWLFSGGTVSEPGEPQYAVQFEISSNLFRVLGLPVARGRAFNDDEDRAGGPPVIILGYSFWQNKYAGSDAAIGSTLVLDAKRYTIVGVASPRLQLDGEADVYTPLGQNTQRFLQVRGPHPIGTIGRLRSGITLPQAQQELGLIGRSLAQHYPDTNKDRTFAALQLRPDVGDVPGTLWLLLAAVGLVLLIACVNVASLLLARAVSRQRELAMRVALGATRFRLARQCLTESGVLGISGGLLGIALAATGIRPFVKLWPGTLPRAEEVHLDWRVLVFAVAVSLASGLLFGIAPAFRAPAERLEEALRAGARTVAGASRRLHGAFVVSEIALAMVLLICAGMLGRTLVRLAALDPGVDINNVLITRVALSSATLADAGKTRAAWSDILDQARHVPGVQAAAQVDTVPMREGNNQVGYWTTPAEPPDNKKPITLATCVTPEYLKVMGLKLRRGRFFTDGDRQGTEHVVVMDEVMAEEAFPGQDPIDKHLRVEGLDPQRVVGIVGHVRHWGPASDDQARVRAQLYYPFAQLPDTFVRRWSELMSITVRTQVNPRSVVAPLRRAIRGATGDQVLYQVRTLDQLASDSLARHRFLLLLFGVFAGLALLLAAIGIYGVLAYLTNQRVPEFGVRMALGAKAPDVLGLVLKQSMGMIAVGIVAGIVGAFAAARLLSHVVAGMIAPDPLTFAIMIAVLLLAALVASLVPASRASHIDPIKALRQE